jgi:pilus assembly protein CpaE
MSQSNVLSLNESATDSLGVFVAAPDLAQFTEHLQRLQRRPAVLRAGGPVEAAAWCAEHGAPAILLVDVSAASQPEQPLQALAELRNLCGPACHIVLLGGRLEIDLYRNLLQSGAFDYLVKPVSLELLARTLKRASEGTPLDLAGHARAGRTVAVVGAAGGAGVSTVVAGLGQILSAQRHTPTVLVDFDRSKGDLPLLLGMQADSGLSAILAGAEIDTRQLQRTLRGAEDSSDAGVQRLQLLSQRPGPAAPVDPERVLQLGDALSQLFSVSLWDLPAHLPEGASDVIEHADIRIVLTELNVQHARHIHRLLAAAGDESSGQRLLIVANTVRPVVREAISKSQFEEFIGRRIDMSLPCAGTVLADSLVDGPLSLSRHRPFAAALEQLADRILDRQSAPAEAVNASLLHKLLGKKKSGSNRAA